MCSSNGWHGKRLRGRSSAWVQQVQLTGMGVTQAVTQMRAATGLRRRERSEEVCLIPPEVYLIPPATVAEGPFYSPQAQTVSFFTEDYAFMCYRLAPPSGSIV